MLSARLQPSIRRASSLIPDLALVFTGRSLAGFRRAEIIVNRIFELAYDAGKS